MKSGNLCEQPLWLEFFKGFLKKISLIGFVFLFVNLFKTEFQEDGGMAPIRFPTSKSQWSLLVDIEPEQIYST